MSELGLGKTEKLHYRDFLNESIDRCWDPEAKRNEEQG